MIVNYVTVLQLQCINLAMKGCLKLVFYNVTVTWTIQFQYLISINGAIKIVYQKVLLLLSLFQLSIVPLNF